LAAPVWVFNLGIVFSLSARMGQFQIGPDWITPAQGL